MSEYVWLFSKGALTGSVTLQTSATGLTDYFGKLTDVLGTVAEAEAVAGTDDPGKAFKAHYGEYTGKIEKAGKDLGTFLGEVATWVQNTVAWKLQTDVKGGTDIDTSVEA